jgi:hypothetical protein
MLGKSRGCCLFIVVKLAFYIWLFTELTPDIVQSAD